MRRLPAAIAALAVSAFVGAPALAHHSMAMFDNSKEILIKGTVARLDWKNPHIYLIVETVGVGNRLDLRTQQIHPAEREQRPDGIPAVDGGDDVRNCHDLMG